MGEIDGIGSPVAENHEATRIPEAPGAGEGQANPKGYGDGRLTAEEHFHIDQRIRRALAEHKRIDEMMKETGLSKAAVYRHLAHIREEYCKWLEEQRKDDYLLMFMASLDSLEDQVRYANDLKKEAKTASEKVKIALAIRDLELARLSFFGPEHDLGGLKRKAQEAWNRKPYAEQMRDMGLL